MADSHPTIIAMLDHGASYFLIRVWQVDCVYSIHQSFCQRYNKTGGLNVDHTSIEWKTLGCQAFSQPSQEYHSSIEMLRFRFDEAVSHRHHYMSKLVVEVPKNISFHSSPFSSILETTGHDSHTKRPSYLRTHWIRSKCYLWNRNNIEI